ncbi:hypothetical protein [Bacteroides caecigallinarum]|uniref:hypothetical protein n=1 Tax=Bacteroides caecigallinarum TaxID=1411144 RepID=UPI0019562177|nr:hypothetical protein [Bacteroides caecigallinarum]MBM6883981.1 hypothetical protein [Bacteroides caecigallinarum]
MYRLPCHSKAPPGPTSARAAAKACEKDMLSSTQVATGMCSSTCGCCGSSLPSAALVKKVAAEPNNMPVPAPMATSFQIPFLLAVFSAFTPCPLFCVPSSVVAS